jgi:steroid delta-isomerase-like uncharacterized protein
MATIQKTDNLHLATEIYNLVNQNDIDHLRDHYAKNVTLESEGTHEKIKGRDGVVEYVRNFKTAFPDLQLKLTRQVVSTNYVVNEYTANGTHHGPLHSPTGDIRPTGRAISVPVCEVMHMKDGEIISSRQYWDSATLLNQLGVI